MEYTIKLTWDPEAGVWIATSGDIPGLVLESGAYDRLVPVFLRPQGSGNVNTRPHDAPVLVVQADNWLHNAHAALLGCWRSAVAVQGV